MKILILSFKEMEAKKSGGAESYISKLQDCLLSMGHSVEVFYASTLLKVGIVNTIFSRKILYSSKCDAFADYDIIINNTQYIIDRRYKSNVIWVQHSSLNFYKRFSRIQNHLILNALKMKKLKKALYYFCMNVFFKKSPISFYENIALFNSMHTQKRVHNKNIFYTYIPDVHVKYERVCKTNSICFLGRFDNESKNILLLRKLANKYKLLIRAFGIGSDEYLLDSPFIKKSFLDRQNFDTLSTFKIALFPNHYEGCCTALHECIESGVLPIVTNFSDEIKFIKDNPRLKILYVKNRNSLSEWKSKIDTIMNLSTEDYCLLQEFLITERHKVYESGTYYNSWEKAITTVFKNVNLQ